MNDESGTWSRTWAIVAGVLLIAAGVALLAVNTFGMRLPFDLGRLGWPVFMIFPGLGLFIVGLATRGEPGVGLSVAGGIVTTVGLILAYQSATDHWSSWAYAWALIAPTSVGLSMLLWGTLHGRANVVRQGLSGLGVGIVVFMIGFAFFEGVLNIGGERGLAPLGRQLLPIALIAAGALIILSRLLSPGSRASRPEVSQPEAYTPPSVPLGPAPRSEQSPSQLPEPAKTGPDEETRA